ELYWYAPLTGRAYVSLCPRSWVPGASRSASCPTRHTRVGVCSGYLSLPYEVQADTTHSNPCGTAFPVPYRPRRRRCMKTRTILVGHKVRLTGLGLLSLQVRRQVF